jgi:hypothetical protein
MTRYRLLAAMVLTAWLATPAPAEYIITIETKTLPSQGGTVDVFIRSTTGSDVLDSFGIAFQIAADVQPPNPRQLLFQSPQLDSQLQDTLYVFYGLSGTPGPLANVTGTTVPFDTYVGGDATADGLGVIVGTTDQLLARLNLTPSTIGSLVPIAGDIFSVSLLSGSNFFLDPNFQPVDFSGVGGKITIQSPSPTPIPEPTTGGLAAAAVAFAVLGRVWRSSSVGR